VGLPADGGLARRGEWHGRLARGFERPLKTWGEPFGIGDRQSCLPERMAPA
jgi:hypothetical protein